MSEQTTMETNELWTAEDVARFLKTSRSWVYQKTEAGILPYLRIGGLLRFEPKAIRAWARGETRANGQVLAMNKSHP
jgi:excisionase family DNA binding protein